MQLSLLSRLYRPADEARRGAPSTVPGAWRDSAIMQLEIIAAAQALQTPLKPRSGFVGSVAFGVVGLAALVLLAQPMRDDSVRVGTSWPLPPAQLATPAPAPAAVAQTVLTLPGARNEAAPAAEGAILDAIAGKAHALPPPVTDTRRAKASVAKPERGRAVETVQSLPTPAPAEPAREVPVPAVQLVQAPRRDVQTLCAATSGNFISEQLCQSRECRKPELRGDAMCERLREIDLARLLRGADH